MNELTNEQRAQMAVELLAQQYPDAECSLIQREPVQLLIATRLSAQCTDARVNMVTPELFSKYPTVFDLAKADIADIEAIIKSCGLYKTKARDIVLMCQMLCEKYNGIVPDTVEELVKLPGVGRKTANLIVGEIYHKPAYIADTHCIRLSNRLGFCNTKDAVKVEKALRLIVKPEHSLDFCHRLVWHGRAVCDARRPQCNICCLKDICPSYIDNNCND